LVENNYQILGVRDNATKDEVRQAFRKLALEYHSDKGGADEKFIKIKQAFDDLKVGKRFPDSPEVKKKKSKVIHGADSQERKRRNRLLSRDVSKEVHEAQEWLSALSRANATGSRLFGSKELGEMEFERKSTNALSIKGKYWAGNFTYDNHIFMWGSITNPYFTDDENKTKIHVTNGTFKMMDPLDNGFVIENGAKILVDRGDIICGDIKGIKELVPDPNGRVGHTITKDHFTELTASNGKIIAGTVQETAKLDADEVLVYNLIDNIRVRGRKILVFGPKVNYDVYFELKKDGIIRFYDKGSGFDISDDAILKLENGKEFFLDDLKTLKLIGYGGKDITYDELDSLKNIQKNSSILSDLGRINPFSKK